MKSILRIVGWLWGVMSSIIWEESDTNLSIKCDVYMECRGSDGKIKWTDMGLFQKRTASRLRFYGADMALIILAILLYSFSPGLAIMPVFGRVATAGLNKLLDATLKTGLTTPTWYVGLLTYVSNTGVTNGTTTFTDAAGTFVAGDVGRSILVKGAGAAGADLNTTIAAVGSGTSITLGAAASNSSSNMEYAIDCRVGDTMASHTSWSETSTYSQANRVAWTPGAISAGSVDNSASAATFSINGTVDVFGAFLVDNNTKGGSTGTLFGAGVNSSGVVRRALNGDSITVTVTCSVTST